jgi:hypothetical protein
MDPGPVPPIVEPESATEHVLILNVRLGWTLAVSPDWRGTGLVGLTMHAPGMSMETPLNPDQVDALRRMLAQCRPDPGTGQEDSP